MRIGIAVSGLPQFSAPACLLSQHPLETGRNSRRGSHAFRRTASLETDTAIGEIAASGEAAGFAVLEAASARKLFFSPSTKAPSGKDAADHTFDAMTGEAAATPPADPTLVRFNNRLRGTVDAALGGLLMQAPEPAKRIGSRKFRIQVERRQEASCHRRRAGEGNRFSGQGCADAGARGPAGHVFRQR